MKEGVEETWTPWRQPQLCICWGGLSQVVVPPSTYLHFSGCIQPRQVQMEEAVVKGTRSAWECLNTFPGLTDETSFAERAMNENGLCVPQWHGTAHLFFGHWGQSVPFCVLQAPEMCSASSTLWNYGSPHISISAWLDSLSLSNHGVAVILSLWASK